MWRSDGGDLSAVAAPFEFLSTVAPHVWGVAWTATWLPAADERSPGCYRFAVSPLRGGPLTSEPFTLDEPGRRLTLEGS